MTWAEAAEEEAYSKLCEEISTQAIKDFTADRLRAVYDREPSIAEKPFRSLVEARALLQTPHPTASFIHAVITSEVLLKGVVLKPIIYGFIHSDSMAPLIVELAFTSTGLDRVKKLMVKIFQDVSNIDLMIHKRVGGTKSLWEEIVTVQKRRDHIMHRAEFVTQAEAAEAVAIAAAVIEELFPALAKSLGYHLHDGFRLCRDTVCSLPPEIRKLLD